MTSTRGEYAKSAEVKRGILDAVIGVISESGFHGLTMATVARRAGISHTGLVHHFPNKEALLTGVIALQDIRAENYLSQSGTTRTDPLATLRDLLGALAFRQAGLVELSTILSAEASASSHPAHEHFQKRYRGMRRLLAELFDRLRESGRLDSPLPADQLAVATIALVEGLHTQWLYEPDSVDIDATLNGIIGMIVPDFTRPTDLRR